MNIKKLAKIKTFQIPISFSIALIILSSLIISLIVITISPETSKIWTEIINDSVIKLFIINTIPIFILIILLFFISNNAVFSCAITGSLFVVGSIANREKIILRQDPFIPSDISLFNEAFGIVKNFPKRQFLFYILIILFFVLLVLTSLIFFKTKKIKTPVRFLGVILTVLIGYLLNFFVYSNEFLYNKFPVNGNIYFDVNQYTSKGFVYSFIYKYNSMKIQKPDGYDKNYISNLDNTKTVAEYDQNKLPHIIMIMGEAFSDLSENSHIDFSNYQDPLKNFKRLSNSPNAISGHIIVPNFGGGTSNTEFDVLTGYPTRYVVKDGMSYSYIRKNTDSIPWRLKDIGYSTLAIHPGFSWFYNRSNVYPHIGFENFIHLSSFQGSEKYTGGYIADKYAADSIIENFEKHIKTNSNPIFEFCVTIENHGPYDNKYENVTKMFDCDIYLDQNQQNLLNNYFTGIKDNDNEIGRIADYLENIDEPVILVFFGDHLPGFSNGMEFFDLLDYDIDPNGNLEEQLKLYSTPFLIWENDAAAKTTNFKAKTIGLEQNMVLSANYLGSMVTQLAGIENLSPFYKFENELRTYLPVIRDETFLFNNSYTTELPNNILSELDTLKHWSYYKVFDD